MNIRRLDADEMEQAIALWRYCFQDPEDFTRWYFRNRGTDVLAMGSDTIITQMVIVPVSMSVRGVSRPTRVISGVATSPEYRRRGLMNNFIRDCIEWMRMDGTTVAVLYPFDYAFYQRYGFAACGEVLKIHIPLEKLPTERMNGDIHLLTHDESLRELAKAYECCYSGYSGHIFRDESAFRMRIEELRLDGGCAVVYRRADHAEGYLLYHFEGKTLIADEIGAATHFARRDLLTYLANHASTAEELLLTCSVDDPIWHLLPEPRGMISIEPYDMLRIMDIPGALCGLPAGAGEIVLRVCDNHALWNTGAWRFTARKNVLYVTQAEDHADAPILSIGELTQWTLGYLSAAELANRGADLSLAQIRAMERLLPKMPFFLYEIY